MRACSSHDIIIAWSCSLKSAARAATERAPRREYDESACGLLTEHDDGARRAAPRVEEEPYGAEINTPVYGSAARDFMTADRGPVR